MPRTKDEVDHGTKCVKLNPFRLLGAWAARSSEPVVVVLRNKSMFRLGFMLEPSRDHGSLTTLPRNDVVGRCANSGGGGGGESANTAILPLI